MKPLFFVYIGLLRYHQTYIHCSDGVITLSVPLSSFDNGSMMKWVKKFDTVIGCFVWMGCIVPALPGVVLEGYFIYVNFVLIVAMILPTNESTSSQNLKKNNMLCYNKS